MSTHDWGVLLLPDVETVIARAAFKVANHFDLEHDDLLQEARILATATDNGLAELAYEGDLGLLQYRLEKDLVDASRREVRNRPRHSSYEERYDDWEDEDFTPPQAVVEVRREVVDYNRELVELLLPAVWDDEFCYGMQIENAPDPDMPRGSSNKATGGTLAAHIADIRRAWDKAPLNDNEKRALVLGYGFDWTQVAAANVLQVSQQSISNWLYSGVGKILATLNGDAELLEQVAA